MATKPNIALARFADTGLADRTAPSGGLRDTGFVGGTLIAEDFVNELFFQNYSWALYLSDGALTGNHTIAGTLGVSSALTVTAGGLVVSAGGAAITGLITANGGVTAAANQHVTVSGTGKHKHGLRTKKLSYVNPAPSGAAVPGSMAVALTAGQGSQIMIPIDVGERILAIRVNVIDSAVGPTKLQFVFASGTLGGTVSTIGASAASAGSGALQTLPLTPLTTTAAAGVSYWIFVGYNVGSANTSFGDVEVDYDLP